MAKEPSRPIDKKSIEKPKAAAPRPARSGGELDKRAAPFAKAPTKTTPRLDAGGVSAGAMRAAVAATASSGPVAAAAAQASKTSAAIVTAAAAAPARAADQMTAAVEGAVHRAPDTLADATKATHVGQAGAAGTPVVREIPAADARATAAPAPQAAAAASVVTPTAAARLGSEAAGAAQRQASDVRASTMRVGNALATSCQAALEGLTELNVKAMDALFTNSVSSLRLIEQLMGARTFADVLRVQAEHSRSQFETVRGQATQLTDLARKMADNSVLPLRTGNAYARRSA